MKKIRYKGYTIEEVDCTTSVTMQCFGRPYKAIKNLYEIRKDGVIVKEYGRRPFITSIADAKYYINGPEEQPLYPRPDEADIQQDEGPYPVYIVVEDHKTCQMCYRKNPHIFEYYSDARALFMDFLREYDDPCMGIYEVDPATDTRVFCRAITRATPTYLY